MTATNHALSGATIAFALHGSWLALPLAFVSHFVIDCIPHYGEGHGEKLIGTNKFRNILIIDATLATLLVLGLAVTHPAHWWLAALSAFVAASPDLMWMRRFIRARRGEPKEPFISWWMRFHSWLQWYQQPNGAYVEVACFIIFSLLLVHFAYLR